MTYLTPRIGFSKRLILLFIFHLLSYLGVALLLTPHFTYAATYTVSPGQSLQDAINQLRGGDTLIINSGTYTPSTTQDNCPITRIPSGAGGATITVASGASVTWIGAVELGNGSPLTNITIDGTPGTLLFDGQRCGGFIISGEVHDSRFEKFEVSHPNMGFVGELINTQFIDLNIHHSGRDDQGKRSQECADGLGIPLDPNASGHCHAIYCSSTCSGNTLRGVHFWNNDGAGFELYNNGHTVTDSIFHDNGSAGMWFLGGGASTAYNNLSYRNWYGVSGCGSQKQFFNNTLVENRENGFGNIGNDCNSPPEARNNILFNNPSGAWGYDQGSQTSNNLTTNPGFVGGDDFHLTANSPVINAGMTLPEVPCDLDGNARPAGSAYDIGAYEYGASPGGGCAGGGGGTPTPLPVAN